MYFRGLVGILCSGVSLRQVIYCQSPVWHLYWKTLVEFIIIAAALVGYRWRMTGQFGEAWGRPLSSSERVLADKMMMMVLNRKMK